MKPYKKYRGKNIRFCLVDSDNNLLRSTKRYSTAKLLDRLLGLNAARITLQGKHKRLGWQNINHWYKA